MKPHTTHQEIRNDTPKPEKGLRINQQEVMFMTLFDPPKSMSPASAKGIGSGTNVAPNTPS
ncbi:MAG: hypothetical protein OXC68_14310 [Aestuariivita sp.]|nr:hypothetical protein [Aestuariivita sp.]